MKKSFLILLLPLLLAGCGDNGTPGHECVDNDKDHLCDICSKKLSDCADNNNDGKCDVCGKEVTIEIHDVKITTLPDKTTYVEGETFDPTGMVVTVSYTDKTTKEVSDYTYSQTPLKTTDTQIVISYGGKSASIGIVVKGSQEDLETYTKTFDFNTDSKFQKFTDAAGFTDSEENKLALKNYFDDQLKYINLLDSLDLNGYLCPRIRLDDGKHYMQFGSQKVVGSLKWNSTVKIYKVEGEVINYTKGEYSVDRNSKFYVDNQEFDLTLDDTETATKKPFSVDYAEGTSNFTLSSTGGRVLLSKLTITWKG